MTRRFFVQRALAAGAAVALPKVSRAAPPRAVIEAVRTISLDPHRYHGWPTVARRANGDLLLAYSGRQEHICPFGRLELMRSRDGGDTWSWPRVLYDGPIDDRDGGIVETAKGTLLATTFTDVQWEQNLTDAEKLPPDHPDAWPAKKLAAWRAARDRAPIEQRRRELGCYMLRSTDGGVTWSARQRVPLNSPHGPTQLRDGRLIFPGIARWSPQQRMGVCESRDDGLTWSWLTDIADRPGDRRFSSALRFNYLELHAVECDDRSIVCQLRNRDNPNDGETLQTESGDGGRNWTPIHPIGVWGSPSHLLRLTDDRLLMTYGHRREPFGVQSRISEDRGKTWSAAMPVYADGTQADLGYPSTVQLEDRTLLTVWYERSKGFDRAQLRQTRWRLAE